MKSSYSRRYRRSSSSTRETQVQKNEGQQEHTFFAAPSQQSFFKPARIHRKSADSEARDKQVNRQVVPKEEEKKINKKDERELNRQPAVQEEEKKVDRISDNKEEEKKVALKAESEEKEEVQRIPDVKEEEKKVQKMSDKKEEMELHRVIDNHEEDKKLAKKETSSNTPNSSSVSNYIHSLDGKGAALPEMTQHFFAERMNHNFDNVRIHTDTDAEQSAKAVNAKAYTVDNHIVFNKGQYNPASGDGKKLLAHELTHVVQQKGSGMDISRQVAPLLTTAQENAAIQFNNSRYDERSRRIIQIITGTTVDGIFGHASARAVAAFQNANGIAVSGRVDQPTLDVMVVNRNTAGRQEHAIQLVLNFFRISFAADTLTIRFDSTVGLATTAFEPGNTRVISVGPTAFTSAAVLQGAINSQLVLAAPAVPALGARPTLLNTSQEFDAIIINNSKFPEARSKRVFQGLVGATPDGAVGRDTVQRIAAFQQTNGLVVDGKIGRATLSQMSASLIGAGDQNAALRLIIDFFDLRDNGNLLDVFFDPSEGANAATDFRPDEPVRIAVGPSGIAQPFEGLVHTLAHEFEHVRRLKEGITDAPTHEFLGEAIEILSEGTPEETLESVAPGTAGFVAGFADDAGRGLANWNNMTLVDRRRFRSRFINVRNKVRARVAAGTPAQRALHAPLVTAYNAVVLP
jgi:peptidoglycan hydrolase-like protein with peptidoglycan-binding domain